MLRHFKMLLKKVRTPIQFMDYKDLDSHLLNPLGTQIYYTPKIQKMFFTQQLAKYVRFIDRKDKIKSKDLQSLVQAILTEYGAIHGLEKHPKFMDNLEFSITRNYAFKENQLSPYHGIVDYMIWLNEQHFVPVMFCENKINPFAGMALADATRALRCIARNDYKNSGHAIVTTGHEWQMFKVYSSMKGQKTVVYEGRNHFRSITKDHEMISVILGLIDECLETEREQVLLLKSAYDVIDEGKHMLEAQTEQQAKKNSPMSKLLTKYYEKKRDSTSK